MNKNTTKSNKSREKFSDLIPGYDKMSPAEKLKARTNIQLNKISKEDQLLTSSSSSSSSPPTEGSICSTADRGWERYRFDKNVPVDDIPDEDIQLDETEAAIQAVRNRTQKQQQQRPLSTSSQFQSQKVGGREEISSNNGLSAAEIAHEQAIFGGISSIHNNNVEISQTTHKDKKRKESEPTIESKTEVDSLINKKVTTHQRGMQNEWLRRVEMMRAAKTSGTQSQNQDKLVPLPTSDTVSKEKRAPIFFQLTK